MVVFNQEVSPGSGSREFTPMLQFEKGTMSTNAKNDIFERSYLPELTENIGRDDWI